jgi:pimeloyl-ACP methyl ester carboxylesterase
MIVFAKLEGGCPFMSVVKRLFVLASCLVFFTVTVTAVEIESRFAKFGDVKIHYQNRGKGDQALVFVHGWTCNSDFWRPQMNDFGSLHLIAVDLAGHGKSDKPQIAYTMEYLARSIEAVLTDAKVKRAVLVGHSMGTPVVRQFYRLFPEQTAGLVIVDGALRMMFPKEQMDQFMAPMKADYKAAAPGVIDGMVAPIKDEKLKDEIKTAMLSTPDYVALSAMEGMFDPSVYKTDTIKVPVLAVLAKSPFWPPDTETFLRSLAPNLEYVEWDEVSHFLMMEKPAEFDQTVEGFLAKNKLLGK